MMSDCLDQVVSSVKMNSRIIFFDDDFRAKKEVGNANYLQLEKSATGFYLFYTIVMFGMERIINHEDDDKHFLFLHYFVKVGNK